MVDSKLILAMMGDGKKYVIFDCNNPSYIGNSMILNKTQQSKN